MLDRSLLEGEFNCMADLALIRRNGLVAHSLARDGTRHDDIERRDAGLIRKRLQRFVSRRIANEDESAAMDDGMISGSHGPTTGSYRLAVGLERLREATLEIFERNRFRVERDWLRDDEYQGVATLRLGLSLRSFVRAFFASGMRVELRAERSLDADDDGWYVRLRSVSAAEASARRSMFPRSSDDRESHLERWAVSTWHRQLEGELRDEGVIARGLVTDAAPPRSPVAARSRREKRRVRHARGVAIECPFCRARVDLRGQPPWRRTARATTLIVLAAPVFGLTVWALATWLPLEEGWWRNTGHMRGADRPADWGTHLRFLTWLVVSVTPALALASLATKIPRVRRIECRECGEHETVSQKELRDRLDD